MSLSATCEPVSQKRTVSSLLAGRAVKKLKRGDGRQLQEAAIQLLEQQQNICSLLREVGDPNPSNIFCTETDGQKPAASENISAAVTGSLLVSELRRRASQLDVPLAALSVQMVLERLTAITGNKEEEEEDKRRELLTAAQRVQLRVLLESCTEVMSQGAICPQLLWQEYRRQQTLPQLEVVFHLHSYNIIPLKHVLERDEGIRSWLTSQLKSLCCWSPPPGEEEAPQVRLKVLSAVLQQLLASGFLLNQRRISVICCCILEEMICWILDSVDSTSEAAGAELWCRLLDSSLCGSSVSPAALQHFFTHFLTQTLTYKPRLTVSDAVALQNQWTFSKSSRLLTSLFRKLAVIFSVDQLLLHLQQVLETQEVNWKHVLYFLSTLLVYDATAQNKLRELLSRLLNSAFEGYDLENMITAFLLARQGALEGPGVFSSYSDWFKASFSSSSSFHASSKKSLVFLLKFLSDLVPFEPPQYLKIHILQPPFVPVKHRSLLMEYVSLAKTRLADLKESVEDMGLYEDVSAAASTQFQADEDVKKAVSLFDNTGRISATVMEASIFRRPYFLTRFLPALLTPRVLPVKADARMSFIEALKKADKIPAAQFSSYMESCQRQRQQDRSEERLDTKDEPQDVLNDQLQEFRKLLVDGNEGDISAHLSRISLTLSIIFPARPEDQIRPTVVKLHTDDPLSPDPHIKVVDMILRSFCQCVLDTSRVNPPNRQTSWASQFIRILQGNRDLSSSFSHRLWNLFHHQGSSLSPAHLLGLAVFVVHLHASMSQNPLVQLVPPGLPDPLPVCEALGSALVCDTQENMVFCLRLCLAAVCYGICRGDSEPQPQPQQQQEEDYICSSFYKKLLYLVPRLLPEARLTPADGSEVHYEEEENSFNLWSSITTTTSNSSWRKTALKLWRNQRFCQLQQDERYQLFFSEWLQNELRVQRHEDVLSDPERHRYQQWVCLDFYLPRPQQHGGCGGDMKILCCQLLDAVMDQERSEASLEKLHHRGAGSCVPDILSRLQEVVYEMEVVSPDVCDFLFELVSQRFSSSDSTEISSELRLQHTLSTWNRVLLTLPAVLFIKVKTEGSVSTLDCNKLVQHINQHQRSFCSPVGLMSFHVTSHFLRGLMSAAARCRGRTSEEFDKTWSQISLQCPLLLLSTVHWWQRLSPVIQSLWRRLSDSSSLPVQLQLISDSQLWADSLLSAPQLQLPAAAPLPLAAAPLLLAACLHGAWRRRGESGRSLSAALKLLRPEENKKHTQMKVFLLFLCVKNYLSALLCPQETSLHEAGVLCSDVLNVLIDSTDWLLIFNPNDQGVYQPVTMVTSDEFNRLMPWAFYSILQQQHHQNEEGFLHRLIRCPGFLFTSILCYLNLFQLFLEGQTPPPPPAALTSDPSHSQVDSSQILNQSKRFLLKLISLTPPTAASCSKLRQLESRCADLDPDLAAALSLHLDPRSLSPEMDFL